MKSWYLLWFLWLLPIAGCSQASSQHTSQSASDMVISSSDSDLATTQPISTYQKNTIPRSPELAAMQMIERHCQLIDGETSLPVNCQLSYREKHSELVLYFGHFDSSHHYITVFSQSLIVPYCYVANQYQQNGEVTVVIYDTQIQRHYSCHENNWSAWESVDSEQLSPFAQFALSCQSDQAIPPMGFSCIVDWFEDVPVLVLSFASMNDVDQSANTPMSKAIKQFCRAGLKQYGDALYLMEVPSFNLAKVTHCGGFSETEWFPIDDKKDVELEAKQEKII
ncbi:hypothetical protein A1QC_08250 [Vibrio rumoiensis 1S-45]|uniref:Lipoprotein n=2 Tax=Vibrio rumoiensis TaxID=76258 RepID=A0A1E5E2N7_9VIBR|nr:hypothetical protein A1QC_08250 [Vibrio rumoiensis 1S-45]